MLTRREGRKIAANGGILIEQLINPACHNGEIAANGPSVTDAIFFSDCRNNQFVTISTVTITEKECTVYSLKRCAECAALFQAALLHTAALSLVFFKGFVVVVGWRHSSLGRTAKALLTRQCSPDRIICEGLVDRRRIDDDVCATGKCSSQMLLQVLIGSSS